MYCHCRSRDILSWKENQRLYEWICLLSEKEPMVHRGITALCQESGRTQINTNSFNNVQTFTHFTTPFILKKYSKPLCTYDKQYVLLCASKCSKSKWSGSSSLHALHQMKNVLGSLGKFCKGRSKQNKLIGAEDTHVNLPGSAFQKDSSVRKIQSLPNMKKSGNHIQLQNL